MTWLRKKTRTASPIRSKILSSQAVGWIASRIRLGWTLQHHPPIARFRWPLEVDRTLSRSKGKAKILIKVVRSSKNNHHNIVIGARKRIIRFRFHKLKKAWSNLDTTLWLRKLRPHPLSHATAAILLEVDLSVSSAATKGRDLAPQSNLQAK